jgi:hypothetical protein
VALSLPQAESARYVVISAREATVIAAIRVEDAMRAS